MSLLKRLPKPDQLFPVYATGVVLIYSWSLLWFFWKIPSWLFYLQFGEILTSFAYILATNFLESLLVVAVPVLVGLILPRKWFLEAFIARGVTLVASALVYIMYIDYRFPAKDAPPEHLLTVRTPQVLVVTLVLVFLAGRLPFLRRLIETLAERATVFLFFSIPVSLIAVLVVLVRNLIQV